MSEALILKLEKCKNPWKAIKGMPKSLACFADHSNPKVVSIVVRITEDARTKVAECQAILKGGPREFPQDKIDEAREDLNFFRPFVQKLDNAIHIANNRYIKFLSFFE